MTALPRQHQKIFAINAPQSQVTTFRSTEDEEPLFSTTPDIIQSEKFTSGWLNSDNTGNYTPFVEDMNGVLLTLSYNTAYLLEKGIPEYSESQTYYINSYCQYLGNLYRCKVDNTINYLPTNTEKWEYIHTESYSTASVGTGESIVATPSGSTFNFKSLVAGTNVTLTPSPEGDAITISASMSGYADFTASSPLSYNGSTGVLTLSKASGSADGYLSSSDWTSFNGKLSSTIFSANNSWTGTNTFSAITLGQDDLATTLGGKQDTISVSSPLSLSSNTISISQANSTTNGYLSSTDWVAFNGKQSAINANNKLSASYISGLGSCATLGYDNSSIKVSNGNLYVNGKQAQLNGTGFVKASGTTISYDNSTYFKTSGGTISGSITLNATDKYIYFVSTDRYIRSSDATKIVIGANSKTYVFGPGNGGNVTSDVRAKKNIIDMPDGQLEVINKLIPRKFDYKSEDRNDSYSAGFIAQEVESIGLTNLVDIPSDPEEMYGLDYTGLIPYIVKALQELSAKVDRLEQQLMER